MAHRHRSWSLYATYSSESPSEIPYNSTLPLALAPNLNNNFPTYLTGIGDEAILTVGPAATNWAKTPINESETITSNTCPASVVACNATGGLVVGVNQGGSYTFGYELPPITNNQFYDQHTIILGTDVLGAANNMSSCQATCAQAYSSGGTTIGSFTVSKTLTHSSINGTRVTQVTANVQ